MSASSASKTPVVRTESLGKVYRTELWKENVHALKDVDLEVPKGDIFGLVGPNGAGKTTLMKMILDFTRPTEGNIRVLGHSPAETKPRHRIGYLPEKANFYKHLTVNEVLRFAGQLHGLSRHLIRKRTDELLERVGLKGARNRRVSQLSKGMTQRMGIAQALINDPDFLIFDEPQSGLDPIGRREIRELLVSLNDSGKTILFSSHILHDVEMICDAVCILKEGELVFDGSIEEARRRGSQSREVKLRGVERSAIEKLEFIEEVLPEKRDVRVSVRKIEDVNRLCEWVLQRDGTIVEVSPSKQALEEFFEELGGGS